MKRIVRLTENDLAKIVKKVIKESQDQNDMLGKRLKQVFLDKTEEGTQGPNAYIILNTGEKITKTNNLAIDETCGNGGDSNILDKYCVADFQLGNNHYYCNKVFCSRKK